MPPYTHVVVGVEHGSDTQWSVLFTSETDCLAYINQRCEYFPNREYTLFKLGEEIKIELKRVEETQPPIVKEKYFVKEK